MSRLLLRWCEPGEVARDPFPAPCWARPVVALGLSTLFCISAAAGSFRHRPSFEWPETPVLALVAAFALVYGEFLVQVLTPSRGWITEEAVGRRRRGLSTYAMLRDVAGVRIRQERAGGPAVLEVRRKGGTSFTIGLEAGLSWARVRKTLRDLGVPEDGWEG